MRRSHSSLAVSSLGLAAALGAAGAFAQSPLEAVKACTQIENDDERLACFDEVAAQLPGSADTAAREAVTPETAPDSGPAQRAETPDAPREDSRADSGEAPERRKRAEHDAPPPAQEGKEEEDRFGLPPEPEPEPEDEGDDTRRMTIADMRRIGPDQHAFLMENGQVWQQAEMERLPPIDPGEEVIISKGFFGGFRLSVKGRAIRVKRVR